MTDGRDLARDGDRLYHGLVNGQPPLIGIFDSGIGGLSVAREVRALLPGANLVYFADSAYCPYGEREPDLILARSLAIAGLLLGRGATTLVIACNTASAVALDPLRARYPNLPIVGMVPAVKPAVAISRNGRIAVLATPRTVAGGLLARVIRDHGGGAAVLSVPAPGLAALVEAGETDGPRVEAALWPILAPALAAGVDTVVLGCTHYPFLAAAIGRLAGPEVVVVDSGAAIARRVRALLAHGGSRPEESAPAVAAGWTFLTSGDALAVGAVAARLLGVETPAARIVA